MRRKLFAFILLFSAIYTLSSCLGNDDNDYVYSNETGITAFSLGTLKQERDTISSTGADSTYIGSLNCSSYVFYIDQTLNHIYNPDSLPYGVDPTKVLCTITSKASGTVTLKSLTSDSLSYYSSTDSIDFSQPRIFRVYSISGLSSRDYTVQINIHKEKAGKFTWRVAGQSEALANLVAMKAVAKDGKIYVFGQDLQGVRIYSTSETGTPSWNEHVPNIELNSSIYNNVAVFNGNFYVLSDGKLLSSADAETWTEVSSPAITRLLGASSKHMYGLDAAGRICGSDNGTDWDVEALDTEADLLSLGNFNLLTQPLKTNSGLNRVTLIGTSATDAQVWSKVEESGDQAQIQPWTYYEVAQEVGIRTPNVENLQVVNYNGKMMAFGGKGIGNHAGRAAFSRFRVSVDGGLTWQTDSLYDIPGTLESAEDNFALVCDSQNYLWLICGKSGQVLRGRLTDLGWKKEEGYFKE